MKDRPPSSYGAVYVPPHHRLRSPNGADFFPSVIRSKVRDNENAAVVSTRGTAAPPVHYSQQQPKSLQSHHRQHQRTCNGDNPQGNSAPDDGISEDGSDRELDLSLQLGTLSCANIEEWKRKLAILLRDDGKQELVSREKKDRRDFEQIAALASRLGLYSHLYSKVAVFSKVPLPNYRFDLDDKRPQREVNLNFSLLKRVDAYLGEYLSQKSRTKESYSDNCFSRSSSNSSIVTDEGLFEQPEQLASSTAVMEKILWRRSLQLRDQQRAWQVDELVQHCKNGMVKKEKAGVYNGKVLTSLDSKDLGRMMGQFIPHFQWRMESHEGTRMLEFRRSLPAYKEKDAILTTILQNQVVIISGETGCGKTTQIPQFILESEIDSVRGAACRIICTQPRRISAMTVSERVATERGEQLGESVGYKVRLEGMKGRDTRLLFCTTGILLRRLLVDRNLKGVTHVIVDEIHERGMNEDFLLIILKDLLPRRPELRLILMSATLDAELFSSYFGGAPLIHIPEQRTESLAFVKKLLIRSEAGLGTESGEGLGSLVKWDSGYETNRTSRSGVQPIGGFTYPVWTHFLENILEMTGYRLTPYNQIDDYGQERIWKMSKQTPRKRKSQIASTVEDALRAADFEYFCPQTRESLLCWNPDSIGFNLIEYLLSYICENEKPGAVLVFMTGWDDISSLKDKLQAHPILGDPSQVLLLTCHGSMASSEQKLIFEEPEDGVRKIVLTTNIAETSITINDVVFVLDCGKAKETSYDALNNTPCLLPSWISKVSAQQVRLLSD
ncbi:hypothetical protein COLO4_04583 [Corchorus olitorius]|uniref:RNA helicase n=1 Tax=Corchorus olitorius TaxID=93759 RepID=A0A1R3KTJ0_9ROSI|nr:hypothetical protein COLO4_04583 [Corchorus olitorius]